MKIAYEKMSTVINIVPGQVTGLVMENVKALYQFLMDIKRAMDGYESGVVISEQDQPVVIPKKVILTEFVNFTINQKSLITKISNEIDEISKNVEFFNQTQKLLAVVEEYIFKLTMDFSCDFCCEKLNMLNLIKGIGLTIVDEFESLEERILTYMDLARDLEGKNLFILVNLRSFVQQEQLQRMMDTALTREHQILLIDNMDYPKLKNEYRIIVDEDLCEI